MPLKVINQSPITLNDGFTLEVEFIKNSVMRINDNYRKLKNKTEQMSLNMFEIIDFRMLSGLIGETLVTDISNNHAGLEKNPNIDGYPDLLNASHSLYKRNISLWKKENLGAFIKYNHGGIEVKNTFGVKNPKYSIGLGHTRIEKINRMLSWKAHHRYTNNLLALFSDYIDGCPQIVAAMFSDCLEESDWKKKQHPKKGSTMTSFTVTEKTGWEKLKAGIKLCHDDYRYLSFFGLETS